jgi:hypothetical protein
MDEIGNLEEVRHEEREGDDTLASKRQEEHRREEERRHPHGWRDVCRLAGKLI